MDEVEREKAFRTALWQVDGVGIVTFQKLISYFGSAEKVVAVKDHDLKLIIKNEKLRAKIEKLAASQEEVINFYQSVVKQGIKILCLGLDDNYPKLLQEIDRPPPVLMVRGELNESDDKAVAVVGTRRPTSYGVEVTRKIVGELVESGVTIVSGLAIGIDACAHRAAWEAGGRTLAVLGGGINRVYPVENLKLAKKIENSGALVSSFAYDTPSLKGNFVARNGIVSGLSLGVLVIEGADKSGTRITANFARAQKRVVMAVPGPITSVMSQMPVSLLIEGAKLVVSGKDVLKALALDLDEQAVAMKKKEKLKRKV